MAPPPGGHEDRPQFQHMLDAGGMASDETEGDEGMEEYVLVDGDIIMGKVTYALETATGDAWVTYGTQTRVMAGETEGQAFERLATIVGARASAMVEQTEAMAAMHAQEKREALLARRIPSSRDHG